MIALVGEEFLYEQHTLRPSHYSSSLRGIVKGVLNLDSANRCCIPEAIFLHLATDESFCNGYKTTPLLLRAGRLLRQSFTSNQILNFVDFLSLFLAMTNKVNVSVPISVNGNICMENLYESTPQAKRM